MINNSALRLIIADDHPIVRLGIKAVLAEQPIRFNLVGEAADGEELLALLAVTSDVDVVITDVSMSQDGRDGLRLFRRLRELYPKLGIVVLTMLNNGGLFRSIQDLGIQCIVSKRSLEHDLNQAIENVTRNRPFISADLRESTLASTGVNGRTPGNDAKLTPREVETLRLLLTGLGVSEIARTLNRSKKTISAQKHAAMAKLGLENDLQLFEYLRNYFEQ